MGFVFDADLLSTLAKIERLELLSKVVGNNDLFIPPAVASDLKRSKSALVQDVLKSKLFRKIDMTNQEKELIEKISTRKNLGMGELECIAICKERKMVLVTNDNQAIAMAEKLDIDVVDLESILYSMKEFMDIRELKRVMADIELKDKVVIVNKGRILRDQISETAEKEDID